VDGGGSVTNRRVFLAGALGGIGVVVTGCGTPAGTDGETPSLTGSASSARRRSAASANPTTSSTTVHQRPGRVRAMPVASAREIIKRATVPVLCYHQLRDWTSSDSRYDRANLICPPRYFRAHLDALADAGWTTISPDQYLAHLTMGARLPAKSVMLSFDDASAGQATEGLPQLAKRGMTGTFFIMTVVLGKPRWMSSQDIRRLADAGMTVGSHTWDHHAVGDMSGRDWKIQLEQTRETLRKASGQPVQHFAYPYGSVSAKAYPHLKEAGYKTAFQLQSSTLDPRAPLFTLRRALVVSTWSGATLVKHLSKHKP
jgi:peptidoglycan/xylan/chitin deacetylase (PgdA/CDA1 family)